MDKNVNTTRRVSAQPLCHQLLGGVSVAMGRMSRKRPKPMGRPGDRRKLPDQLARLFDAQEAIIGQARRLAQRASQLDHEGINDLVGSEALRMSELQTRFPSAHLVNVPLDTAGDPSSEASRRGYSGPKLRPS
jgi:hypothetical protein